MTSGWARLRHCESDVEDRGELLWRQIHPRFLVGELVQSEGFVGPAPGSAEISVVRAARCSAAEAARHHREVLGLASAGTWADDGR